MEVVQELAALLPAGAKSTPEDTWDALRQRVTVLSERVWEGRNRWPEVEAWLANFDGRSGLPVAVEQLHALFLLSQFIYVGAAETRVLLHAIFRDLFLIPLIQEVRDAQGGTRDMDAIARAVDEALARTRFLGIGSPAASGVHLLYLFRQESGLLERQFLDPSALFSIERRPDGTSVLALGEPDVDRYVFLDDVCGSGTQVVTFSRKVLSQLVALKPGVRLQYLAMFGCDRGLSRVRTESLFGSKCDTIFELDPSYRSLSERARILQAAPPHIDGETLRKVVLHYGALLQPDHPTGFQDAQLLLGFHHNTPDNTLPIIWAEGTTDLPWTPAFRRHPKT